MDVRLCEMTGRVVRGGVCIWWVGLKSTTFLWYAFFCSQIKPREKKNLAHKNVRARTA